MINKYNKAISSVVAIALLLVVAVLAVTSFQGWFDNFSSNILSDVEIQSSQSNFMSGIDTIVLDKLYFKNNIEDNLTILNIKIGDKNCNISKNISLGMQSIDLGDCSNNLSKNVNDVVIITDKKIFVKTILFDNTSSSLNGINFCSDVSIVSYWNFDNLQYDDNFDDGSINLNRWNINGNGNIYLISNKLELKTNNSIWSYPQVAGNSDINLTGDFDVQVDFDATNWISVPASQGYEVGLSFSIDGDSFHCLHKKEQNGLRYYKGWRSDISSTFVSLEMAHTLGKMRATRVNNVFSCYYWNGGGWTQYGTFTSNNVLGSGFMRLHLTNRDNTDVINASFDNFIVNKGELVKDNINSNDGVIDAAVWTSGKVTNALEFDGVDDYVHILNNSINLKDFTLGAWIKTGVSGNRRIFSKDNFMEGGTRKFIFLKPSSPNLAFSVMDDGSTTASVTSSTNILDNQWHYVVGSRKAGENLSLYIDGVLVNSVVDTTSGIIDSDTPFTIGAIKQSAYSDEYFDGTIDEVIIFNRSLNQSEILELYNKGNNGKGICS